MLVGIFLLKMDTLLAETACRIKISICKVIFYRGWNYLHYSPIYLNILGWNVGLTRKFLNHIQHCIFSYLFQLSHRITGSISLSSVFFRCHFYSCKLYCQIKDLNWIKSMDFRSYYMANIRGALTDQTTKWYWRTGPPMFNSSY